MVAKTLLCLSSGLTSQYRLDVLRALGLPEGCHIQFRYGESLISPLLLEALSTNRLIGAAVLLAHVDCTEAGRRSDGTCPITPCRHAALVESRRVGAFLFLRYRLGEYAPCSDSEGV